LSEKKPINLEASVRRRLLNVSRERDEDFNLVLTRYATERFLYRLSMSPYTDQFVLKGALLIGVWLKNAYRPTRDIDLIAVLLSASFRQHLTMVPLRFASPSPPSGWTGDFHPQAA